MARAGQAWRFTLRLPTAFRDILKDDSGSRSGVAFVRASFGPMTCREARGIAEAAVTQCRTLFAVGLETLQAMQDIGPAPNGDDAIYANLSAEKRAVVDEVLAATTEALQRLKASRPGRVPPHLLIAPMLDQLKAFEAAARLQPTLAHHLHEPARETVRAMLQSLGRDGAVVDHVPDFVDVGPFPAQPKPKAGDLFSVACERYIKDMAARNTMAEKDVRRYERMLWFFRKVAGDREVGAYQPPDIMSYVTLLRTLPARFSPEDVVIEDSSLRQSGSAPRKTLSVGTVASYLAPVRSVFIRECLALQCRNPCDGIRVEKPGKNRPSKTRPLSIAIINEAIRLGRDEGSFAAIMMPILALLTARRIGLLTYMNKDWIEKVEDRYIVRPSPTVLLPDRQTRTPIKTDESFTPFVLHDELIRMGLLDLLTERGFLFLEALSTSDPPAALSKRMNGLLKRAGARGRDYGETFHALRSRGIIHYRTHVPQAVRLQVGHAASDEHESYDWAEIEPELVPTIASVPLPKGIDVSPINGVSWSDAIEGEERLYWAGEKRRAKRGDKRNAQPPSKNGRGRRQRSKA